MCERHSGNKFLDKSFGKRRTKNDKVNRLFNL